MTTTAIEIDEELQNRCLVLTVNEDRDQTRRIHELQRQARTLSGVLRTEEKKRVLRVHRNAQRLLRPLLVVNPFAEHLTFSDRSLRTRRDHMKYLNLINAIALLHQRQRPIRTVTHHGKRLSYIEVTLEDIDNANELAGEVMGVSLDELPPQTRKLLMLVHELVNKLCEEQQIEIRDLRLSRRQIREYSGWHDTRLRIHLARLVEMEYLTVHPSGRGRTLVYELLYDGQGTTGERFMMQLIDTEKLASSEQAERAEDRKTHDYDDASAGGDNLSAGQSDLSAPQKHPDGPLKTPHMQGEKSDVIPSNEESNSTNPEKVTENHVAGHTKNESSPVRRSHADEDGYTQISDQLPAASDQLDKRRKAAS